MKEKLDNIEELCSDSHRSYTACAKGLKPKHNKFNASNRQRKTEKIKHKTQCMENVTDIVLASNTTWFDYKQPSFDMLVRT